MPCRFCGHDKPLVKAHALPESFFRELRVGEDDSPPLMLSSTPGARPKRSPIGVYDKDILCADCETVFGPYDTYGAEVLIQKKDELFRPIRQDLDTLAFFADGVDQHKLKLFVLSVLWRATLSSQTFYQRMQLGPHQEQLKQRLLAGACSDPDDYSVLLSRWVASDHRKQFVRGLMCPFLERWDGINAVRFYFGWTVAYIKVDKRPFAEPLRNLVLGRTKQTVQIAREFDSSKDFRVMLHVARAAASEA